MDITLTYGELNEMQNLIRAYIRGHNCPALHPDTKELTGLAWTAPTGSLSLEGVGTVRWDSDKITFELL